MTGAAQVETGLSPNAWSDYLFVVALASTSSTERGNGPSLDRQWPCAGSSNASDAVVGPALDQWLWPRERFTSSWAVVNPSSRST